MLLIEQRWHEGGANLISPLGIYLLTTQNNCAVGSSISFTE
jgi:hypothetical protein